MLATERAEGFWPDILVRAGFPSEILANKRNQPCPFCPGQRSFRFADKGKGLWICTHCTESKYSQGLDLLRRHMNFDWTAAAAYVHEFFDGGNISSVEREARLRQYQAPTPEMLERRVAKMRRLWSEARPIIYGDPVHRYLMQRVPQLTVMPQGLRYHPNLEYWVPNPDPNADFKYQLLGKYPAMLAKGEDPDGNLVQLHKTYLTADGHRRVDVPDPKKTDVGIGSNSFAFRIYDDVGEELGVAEGIETAAAASVLWGIPVWPCHCSSIMANFVLPRVLKGRVRKLVIFQDNDIGKVRQDGSIGRAGQAAAATLAKRARQDGLKTLIVTSPKAGTDIADLVHSFA